MRLSKSEKSISYLSQMVSRPQDVLLKGKIPDWYRCFKKMSDWILLCNLQDFAFKLKGESRWVLLSGMEEWSLLMERGEGGWSLDHGQLSMPGLTKFCFKCVTQISKCFDFIFDWLKIHCLGAGTVTMWKVELMATSKSAFKSKVVLGYLITELNCEIYHCSPKLGGSSRLSLYPERQISTCWKQFPEDSCQQGTKYFTHIKYSR